MLSFCTAHLRRDLVGILIFWFSEECFVSFGGLIQIFFAQGFKKVFNVAGGIHVYAVNVDPSVPTY